MRLVTPQSHARAAASARATRPARNIGPADSWGTGTDRRDRRDRKTRADGKIFDSWGDGLARKESPRGRQNHRIRPKITEYGHPYTYSRQSSRPAAAGP
eukprot:scaffold21724_cov82-Isochrysis_galbana.AAC.2